MRKRSVLLSLGALFAKPSLALNDPKPSAMLLPAIGSWQARLTYVDYQAPYKAVTLPTRLVATLSKPDELALYYVFDDGPGKTVHSYEQMRFEWSRDELIWTNGITKPRSSVYKVSSATAADDGSTIKFARPVDSGVDKFSLEITARSWRMGMLEIRTGKPELQRSTYELTKT